MSRLFNHETLVLHPDCTDLEDFVRSVPELFRRKEGRVIHQGRNELREFEYKGKRLVV